MDKVIVLLTNSNYQAFRYFILGSAVTFIFSYLFYKLTLQGGKLAYHSFNNIVIDKKNQSIPDDFKISYAKDELSKLVRTNIYFWNRGNKPIREDDIDKVDKENHLSVKFDKDIQIYSCNIVKNTDTSNGMNLDKKYNNGLKLYFKYLEPNDGIRIEILHNDDTAVAKITGKVIGVSEGVKNSKDLIDNKITSVMEIVGIIGLYISLFAISFLMLYFCMGIYNKLLKQEWIVIVGSILFSMFPAIVVPIVLKHLSKSKKYPTILDDDNKK